MTASICELLAVSCCLIVEKPGNCCFANSDFLWLEAIWREAATSKWIVLPLWWCLGNTWSSTRRLGWYYWSQCRCCWRSRFPVSLADWRHGRCPRVLVLSICLIPNSGADHPHISNKIKSRITVDDRECVQGCTVCLRVSIFRSIRLPTGTLWIRTRPCSWWWWGSCNVDQSRWRWRWWLGRQFPGTRFTWLKILFTYSLQKRTYGLLKLMNLFRVLLNLLWQFVNFVSFASYFQLHVIKFIGGSIFSFVEFTQPSVSLFDQTHLILRTAIMLVDSFFIDASFSDIVSTDVKIDPRSMP